MNRDRKARLAIILVAVVTLLYGYICGQDAKKLQRLEARQRILEVQYQTLEGVVMGFCGVVP